MGCSPIKNNEINIPNIEGLAALAQNNKNRKELQKQAEMNQKSTLVIHNFKEEEKFKEETKENISEYDLLLGNQINSLSIKTEIFLSCKNLPKMTSSLNSYVKVFRNDNLDWIQIGKTEICRYSSNPYYVKSFIMNYHFEEDESFQQLKFMIYFIENEESYFVGEAKATLKDILTSKNQELERLLDDKKAKIIIKGSQKQTNAKYVQFRLGIKGKRMTKSKIYCKISKKGIRNDFFPIYLTEEKEQIYSNKKERLFFWNTVELQLDRLNTIGLISKIEDSNQLLFQIFELTKKDRPNLLTEAEVITDEMNVKREFRLKQVKDEFHFLIIDNYQIIEKYTLFSFLVSHMEYQCSFFLDLSRSKYNVDASIGQNSKFADVYMKRDQKEDAIYRPTLDIKCLDKDKFKGLDEVKEELVNKNVQEEGLNDQAFLEFFEYNKQYQMQHGRRGNRRQQVIKGKEDDKNRNNRAEMVELLKHLAKDQFELDTDSKCALFGYGCKIPEDYEIICNCLSLTYNIMYPEVTSFSKILEIYDKAMEEFFLSGPAMINESLNHFFNFVTSETFDDTNQKYFIGFYIVSSKINDSPVLFKQMTKYYDMPCTIVLVSIGNEFDYESFEKEIEEYKAQNLKNSVRNILIYLNFNEIIKTFYGTPNYNEKIKLTCKYVYNRINDQFIEFVNLKKVKPINNEDLANRNTPDFIEFRKKRTNEKFIPCKYLQSEKEKLINDVLSLKYTMDELESAFNKKYPTFDRHFIFSRLNKLKIEFLRKEEKNRILKEKKAPPEEKKYIRFENGLYLDERELLMKKEVSDTKASITDSEVKKYSKVICNICRVNKINIIFLDCKHKFCCLYCIGKLKNETCPICNKKISLYVRTYKKD